MRKSKKAKAKAGIERTTSVKTSVKSYQQGIESEKQKTSTYSKEFEAGVKSLQTGVKSLQADITKHSKDIKNAALKMREEGIEHMGKKVAKFGKEIEDQITENREATSHMADNVKYFISEIDKKKKNFQSYVQGPFTDYIKAFWG